VVAIGRWHNGVRLRRRLSSSGQAVNGTARAAGPSFIGTAGRHEAIRSAEQITEHCRSSGKRSRLKTIAIGIERVPSWKQNPLPQGAPGGQPVGAHGPRPWPGRGLQAAISADGVKANRRGQLEQCIAPKLKVAARIDRINRAERTRHHSRPFAALG